MARQEINYMSLQTCVELHLNWILLVSIVIKKVHEAVQN